MMKGTCATWRQRRPGRIGQCLLMLLLMVTAPPSRAEMVTIGKGVGIIWEGLPFNVTMSGPMDSAYLGDIWGINRFGLIAISNLNYTCLNPSNLTTIAGYQALRIAPGVGLIPRATGSAQYYLASGWLETLVGTIGLPESRGQTSSGFIITNPIADTTWCIPPRMTAQANFFYVNANRTATLSGNWVMVTDGTQTSSEIIIPAMYAGSYSQVLSGDRFAVILPSAITLRISTLSCAVETTTNINFGSVRRNTQFGSELGILSYPLTVTCSQLSDRINANINVQFRAITGLHEGAPTRLTLRQGGGYITGEINNGVTGSGACNGTAGIPLDGTQLQVGSIGLADATRILSNQVTWRLCSGGASLPTGPVDASAEVLVTFN
ncbi:hypothetical protein [Edaphovirga cremea]|uniref:hypothetical protein n=1 Tax=Edaphovirga cremea TaxID=2267246 RepID=UPI001FE2ABFA|nr:hypothetical protein [Edaphovirga cremea]